MAEFVIKLNDDSKIGLLLATLKRLVTSHGVGLSVEQNGQRVALEATLDDDARFEAMVNQIITDVMAEKIERLTPEEAEAEWRELAAYGEQKAAELGITSDEDVDRLVKEYRKERRVKHAA
ncbi:MAG: hypothetical protein ACREEM_31280 [Blastocatellia bacterium]